jgi:hypothetical protein
MTGALPKDDRHTAQLGISVFRDLLSAPKLPPNWPPLSLMLSCSPA